MAKSNNCEFKKGDRVMVVGGPYSITGVGSVGTIVRRIGMFLDCVEVQFEFLVNNSTSYTTSSELFRINTNHLVKYTEAAKILFGRDK